MSVPKAVVFDLGKVLVEFDFAIALRRFVPLVAVSPFELARLVLHTPLLVNYESGLISNEEFFRQVSAATGFRGTFAEFSGMFGDIFTELPAMVALHAEVRRQGLRTYILSNTNDLAVRHIQATFPFFRHFDGYVYSYEHRCLKPDVRLYEALEQVSGLRGSDLFYLDDRSENIAPAQQRGWQTLVHRSPKESRAALIRAGVLPAH